MLNRSEVIVLTNRQTDRQTNKQTDAPKTSTSLRCATPVGKKQPSLEQNGKNANLNVKKT